MIERVKMPKSDGRTVPDKFVCNVGHFHPSHRHALACNDRLYRKALLKGGKK